MNLTRPEKNFPPQRANCEERGVPLKELFFTNPILLNELRQSAFRHHTRIALVLWFGLTVVFVLLSSASFASGFLVWFPVLILPLIIPAISSGAFAKEYEQQTWQDLYLTRLTNAQVVVGKFTAYLIQILLFLSAFAPMYFLINLRSHRGQMSGLQDSMVPIPVQIGLLILTLLLMSKILLSGVFYILLSMVCSRYSPNRRVSLVWCYIALGIYALFSYSVWSVLNPGSSGSALMLANQVFGAQSELMLPGYMDGIHFALCSIVGVGSIVLIWVSMGEQRGYKGSDQGGGISRSWQPIAKRIERG